MLNTAKKLVVAIDVDEVLAGFVERLCEFHNAEFDTSLSILDFHSYHFADVWGGSVEDSIAKVDKFFDSPFFEDLPRVPGSVEALRELHATGKFSFVVVTSRQHRLEQHTRSWLDKHFTGIFSSVQFGNHYGTSGAKRDKSAMCLEIGARVIVDDSMKYAQDCASAGINVLLFDLEGKYPWSKVPAEETVAKSITRLHSWEHVKEQLHALAAHHHANN